MQRSLLKEIPLYARRIKLYGVRIKLNTMANELMTSTAKVPDIAIPIDFYRYETDGIVEHSISITDCLLEASYRKILFKHIHLCHGTITIGKGKSIRIDSPEPVFYMNFSLQGESTVRYSSGKTLHYTPQQHNLQYVPDPEFYIDPGKQAGPNTFFLIIFREEYLRQLLPENYDFLDYFMNARTSEKVALLHQDNCSITHEMQSIINEIIGCKRKGILKCLFLEAKIIKLLMLQLEQFELLHYSRESYTLSDYDLKKIHYAKTLVEQNLTHPLSLLELARQSGLNDFKLKKGFKEVYGNTVFGYLKVLRMQEARKLLLDKEHSINTIAHYCGYRFVQNFTRAFKEVYGSTPEKFRKS